MSTDLDEISRLLERATPAPWRDDNGYRVYADTPEGEVLLLSTKQTCATSADSGLIAALRNFAPELIADARRYRWLCDNRCVPWGEVIHDAHNIGIDAAIDAAMAAPDPS
jgi:hypothetical protein